MLIVTDAAVDLPPSLATVGIRVVSGGLWVADEPFAGDGAAFWAMIRGGTYPSTTPPTVDALAEAYLSSDPVCALHVSADLSATVARGREAAVRVGPGVVVVDTRSFSVGSGLIVAAARRSADNDPHGGTSLIDFAETLPDRLHTFVLVQDAEPLRRSGRAGLIPDDRLKRGRPLLLSVRGRSVLLEQPKDRGRGLRQLIAHGRFAGGADIGAWALAHGDASDVAAIADATGQALGVSPAFVVQLDPTVGAHVGPDAVVLAVLSGPVDL